MIASTSGHKGIGNSHSQRWEQPENQLLRCPREFRLQDLTPQIWKGTYIQEATGEISLSGESHWSQKVQGMDKYFQEMIIFNCELI